MATITYPHIDAKAWENLNKEGNKFLTGPVGAGMDEIIVDFIEKQKREGKKVVLVGVNAMVAAKYSQGRTLHSFFNPHLSWEHYDFITYSRENQDVDTFVIVGVNMMRRDDVQQVYEWWINMNKKPRIIMCGDFFELPPFSKGMGEPQYAFESKAGRELHLKPIILDGVVNQKDKEYIKMLHYIRQEIYSYLDYFNSNAQKGILEKGIYLCARNSEADSINSNMMSRIQGISKEYLAKGDLKGVDFNKISATKRLVIKQNMRVMALRNDSQGRYTNGSLGCVVDMAEEYIRVRFDNGNEVNIYRTNFYGNQNSNLSEKHCIKQFPLQVGYAITIHKSQGQVFDAVNVLATRCWEHGQLYVALSRVRTIQGLHLIEPLDWASLVVDKRVIDFYGNLEEEFHEMVGEE